jgi:nucleoside-diphosphate-sugar epimerase
MAAPAHAGTTTGAPASERAPGRVFVAGATGAIGRRLVPLLITEGHRVSGLTRSQERGEELRAAGAEPVVADALDERTLVGAIEHAAPRVVVHQLTAIPQRINPRRFDREFAMTDRLRTEGTAHLLAAARSVGARVIAQSIAFCYAPGPMGTVHGEDDALVSDAQAAKEFRHSAWAIRELERLVLEARGVVLRYGYFYGPGTSISRSGSIAEDVARRRLPIIGSGAGVWSFVHIDDAAAATVAAVAQDASGPYNIVDDDPAPAAAWIPALAQALGAPRPLRAPALVARLAAGEHGVAMMTHNQGASNARARQQLGWAPRYASWREGFRSGLD